MRKMTERSLADAFTGESQAHTRYRAFSRVAEEAGLPNVARLFAAIAEAELIHATNHAKNLGAVGDTAANLQTCIDGENYEVNEMYPAFIAVAREQGEKGAERSMSAALRAEKVHSEMYSRAREAVVEGRDADLGKVVVCEVCGWTAEGDPPDRCPVCGAPREKFKAF